MLLTRNFMFRVLLEYSIKKNYSKVKILLVFACSDECTISFLNQLKITDESGSSVLKKFVHYIGYW